jgi:hypothetical protein
MGEKLIQCDVSHLVRLPATGGRPSRLLGTEKQVHWAMKLRGELAEAWKPDLPVGVFKALFAIEDATWWIANCGVESAHIKWPTSWLAPDDKLLAEVRPPSAPTARQRSLLDDLPSGDVEAFQEFAIKMARNPGFAYLTILALAYRATKDERIFALLVEARERQNEHLKAIETLAGKII